jgi:hypothetical protein
MIPLPDIFAEEPSVKPAAIILLVQDLTQHVEFSSENAENRTLQKGPKDLK